MQTGRVRKQSSRCGDATMNDQVILVDVAPRDGIELAGAIATAFGCPFEGAVDPEAALRLAAQFVEAGVAAVDFADTVGMAVPNQIKPMLKRARREFPKVRLGIHVHNTRNIGLANAYAALEEGLDGLDASTGGAGGCPIAPQGARHT